MKAKQYFEKYEPLFDEARGPENIEKVALDLFVEVADELYALAESRNIQSEEAQLSLIKEFNQKWNAIYTCFEKKYGDSPIKWNGFKDGYKRAVPAIADKL